MLKKKSRFLLGVNQIFSLAWAITSWTLIVFNFLSTASAAVGENQIWKSKRTGQIYSLAELRQPMLDDVSCPSLNSKLHREWRFQSFRGERYLAMYDHCLTQTGSTDPLPGQFLVLREFGVKNESKYKLETIIATEFAAAQEFIEPKLVRMSTKSLVAEELLIAQANFSGSGGFSQRWIFLLEKKEKSTELVPIQFESIATYYKSKLKDDQEFLKGDELIVTNHSLEFSQVIHKTGDAACCATGGKITGSYKLISDKKSRRLVVDKATVKITIK